MAEEECQCLHCTLVRAVIEVIYEDDDGEPDAPLPMTRARAEFMKQVIDRQEPAKKRFLAAMAIRINDKTTGTGEGLPADIANHFRAIAEGDPVGEQHPLELVDPPIGSKWGR